MYGQDPGTCLLAGVWLWLCVVVVVVVVNLAVAVVVAVAQVARGVSCELQSASAVK
jgi:hypothetical protein